MAEHIASNYRRLWEKHHDPIPEGFVIHHINGDHDDNRIDNLQCLSYRAHLAVHGKFPSLGGTSVSIKLYDDQKDWILAHGREFNFSKWVRDKIDIQQATEELAKAEEVFK